MPLSLTLMAYTPPRLRSRCVPHACVLAALVWSAAATGGQAAAAASGSELIATAISFNSSFGSYMVLQQQPAKACVYGILGDGGTAAT